MWLRNTCARFAAIRRSDDDWCSSDGQAELLRLLNSDHTEEIGRGLLTCCGLVDKPKGARQPMRVPVALHLPAIERHVFRDERELIEAAVWAWVLVGKNLESSPKPSSALMDRLLWLWLADREMQPGGIAAFALTSQAGMPLDACVDGRSAATSSTSFRKDGRGRAPQIR